jgi:hypothetical protein
MKKTHAPRRHDEHDEGNGEPRISPISRMGEEEKQLASESSVKSVSSVVVLPSPRRVRRVVVVH